MSVRGSADVRASRETNKEQSILCVDLDGTLVLTDTLYEQLILLVKTRPTRLLSVLWQLIHGRAAFKRALSSELEFRPEHLPYHQGLVAFLNQQAKRRRVILTTAADARIAEKIVQHFGFLDGYLASDGVTNLSAEAKLEAIRSYFPGQPFEYIGNSRKDVPVWQGASGALAVGSVRRLRQLETRHAIPWVKQFPCEAPTVRTILKAVRAYQWCKNLLVFVPIFLSHSLLQWRFFLPTFISFLALSAAASALYIANDLLDLEADRSHPRKCQRPFASGALTIPEGLLLLFSLLVLATLLAEFLSREAQALLGLYVLTSAAYSFLLKRKIGLDVVTLAGLYTLRLFYGSAATATVISPWTLAFCLFLFTSLAMCKRLTELRRVGEDEEGIRRSYNEMDMPTIVAVATASGYIAMLVLALYLLSPDVATLYSHPQMLWLICPLVTYWITRVILAANRGEMHDDPIVFAFRDRVSWAVAIIVMAIFAGAL